MWRLRQQGPFAPGLPQVRILSGEAGNHSKFKGIKHVWKLRFPGDFCRNLQERGKMDELFEKMKKLIADKLEVDEGKITMDASFRQDLGADSLDTYELVYAIEEEMGISIPDEKANEFETVKDAYEYIKSQQK
jgi:acyl carrier protein